MSEKPLGPEIVAVSGPTTLKATAAAAAREPITVTELCLGGFEDKSIIYSNTIVL
jgi:hypothetical protein